MILIADDDFEYTKAFLDVLRVEGYRDVRVAGTGSETISLIAQGLCPDVIVLDMMIPYEENDFKGALPPEQGEEPRGVRVTRELVDRGYRASQIVVITALLDSDLSLRALQKLGVRYIFTKPVLTKAILQILRKIHPPGGRSDA